MSKKVAIVIDSTSAIPEELTAGLPIHSIPLTVIWSGDELADGIDISPEEFYERLATAKEMPSTSQPSPAAFKEIYEKLDSEGYDILCVLISAKLSGTIASASQARGMVPDANIEIVDSENITMPTGFAIWLAAKAAKDGASLEECKEIAEKACQHAHMIFMVDTLEFLHRGGRIGGAARFIGTVLNFKPLLQIKDGGIDALGRERSKKKAINALVEEFRTRTSGKKPTYVAVLHANVEEDARKTLEILEAEFEIDKLVMGTLSPVVGTHTGPGAVAIAFVTGYEQ